MDHGARSGLTTATKVIRPLFDPVQFQLMSGWGGTLESVAQTCSARTTDDIRGILLPAAAESRTIISRGSGYSYGDPALNGGNLILDLTAMNRILAFDELTGVVDVEPGVTVGQLCRHAGAAGWWPPVVPGTQAATLGGCLAANVHGKNNWKCGPLGEHVQEINVLLADGSEVTYRPNDANGLFRAVIGGFGLLGVITRIRLQMRRSSQLLHIDQFAAPELEDVLNVLHRGTERGDSVVAWIDGFATGPDLGRGLIQIAESLPDGVRELTKLASKRSRLPEVVRSNLWLLMKPMASAATMRKVNEANYYWGLMHSGRGRFTTQSRFEFFHDFVPGWNRAFGRSIVQYQMFLPETMAATVFRAALEWSSRRQHPPFLVVLKRHRADSFLLSEGVDGYSMSMDFHVDHRRVKGFEDELRQFTDDVVLPEGGRFYLAKDSVLSPHQARQSFGPEAVDSFLAIKQQVDPRSLFQSDMYRRLLCP